MFRNNAFAAVVLMLAAACNGSGPVDDAPEYETSSQAGSGSAAQVDGGEQDAQSSGDAQQHPAAESTECDFHGPYRLVATLTTGSASCPASAEYASATLQTRDVDACTGSFCVDGRNCVRLECERGAPVTDCSATIENNGCEYVWTLVVGE